MVFADYTFIRRLPYNRLYNYHGGVLMKKKFGLFLGTILMFLLVTGGAQALTYYDNNWYTTYGPNYLGDADPFIATIDGNDNPNQDLGDLNHVINDWNDYFDGHPDQLMMISNYLTLLQLLLILGRGSILSTLR